MPLNVMVSTMVSSDAMSGFRTMHSIPFGPCAGRPSRSPSHCSSHPGTDAAAAAGLPAGPRENPPVYEMEAPWFFPYKKTITPKKIPFQRPKKVMSQIIKKGNIGNPQVSRILPTILLPRIKSNSTSHHFFCTISIMFRNIWLRHLFTYRKGIVPSTFTLVWKRGHLAGCTGLPLPTKGKVIRGCSSC